jgi:hypothetical protein
MGGRNTPCPWHMSAWVSTRVLQVLILVAIGFAIAVITAANAQDRIYRYLTKRSGGKMGQPEFRVSAILFHDRKLRPL